MRTPLVLAAAALFATLPAAPALAFPEDPSDPGTGGVDYPRGGEGPEGSEIAFEFQDPRISESSGIAPSLLHEGVWWTHNDSGEHLNEVYAVDEEGHTLATVTLNLDRRDWEAITVAEAPDGTPSVLVADIGDNFDGGWPDVSVHRFPEPGALADTAVDPQVFTFTYEDGGRDAESLMVDPRDGRMYVVTKEFSGGLYAAPEELEPGAEHILERIDSAPLFATDAAFSPDGSRYVVRTYWGATVYDATGGVPGSSLGAFDLPESDQGEAIAFTPDGTALMAGTEGPGAPVWRIPLEDRYLAEEPPVREVAAREAPAGEGGTVEPETRGALPFIVGGGAVAALVIVAIVLLARRG
ncbi:MULTISPECIES: hypothetical protein [Nocardiopsis]|uniref:WD40 repeat domain-containing protein n=1 Tax=Nocardiopsis dassonvillei (strain ATCC 23218 / DSM 43111 / CIP 107115 / JCM 7437 / KCTC 9190 / NBRC 14626 / NCTC 10488 / NRRL B-5397 / IMRU 509) TaxID=446468 RepID=D7AV18_NOCDD|nr:MULTISPECIES: hypothetical protein [Nocardiopsis]ADH69568.1 conserved hypothetical protein [Nocardiopsis dassonvillei subsp. dassonvillei DSM 43111]APC37569.1 hypothetical protein A9R04_24120 [Nocardiopsis dassonvillei]NKY79085.1 hypothetical protein [Nocardiopsis dassonvillei]VEI90078.1 Uncharacterised protein [Nocardiopsis dassonvillei]